MITLYYDKGNGTKGNYNAWLYKSKDGKSYGIATDTFGLWIPKPFLYQDWMPSWIKQYKYEIQSIYYFNL